jgi:UDPglucose--hexose-1-phosphate uridylyltransferase
MSAHDQSHSRKNILTGEWVLVSPHRTLRPWQGETVPVDSGLRCAHDPDCYLCPGNERARGHRNPDYTGPFIFDNDFPALSNVSDIETTNKPLFQSRSEHGCCRVVCFSERHDQRIATMPDSDVEAALTAIVEDFSALDRSGEFGYVQVFENRGEMMGCSNQHPHAQIWATEHLPTEPAKELAAQREYYRANSRLLLRDYLDAEAADGRRMVAANDDFVSLVPYWATWPFEQMIIPRRDVASPSDFTAAEISSLASLLKAALAANDALFATSAPYSMGFHPRPSGENEYPEWLFHIHIYPPLLRSASIKKHLVGFEMLGMPQRDLTPEVAAARLRECNEK